MSFLFNISNVCFSQFFCIFKQYILTYCAFSFFLILFSYSKPVFILKIENDISILWLIMFIPEIFDRAKIITLSNILSKVNVWLLLKNILCNNRDYWFTFCLLEKEISAKPRHFRVGRIAYHGPIWEMALWRILEVVLIPITIEWK